VGNDGNSLISLRRGIRVLEFTATKNGGRTFSDILAEFNDMTPATLTRLLKSMLDEELLLKASDSRNYQTGSKAKRLASAIQGTLSNSEKIRPVVDELAETSGESALFSEFERDVIRLVVKSEVPDGFHYMDENKTNPNLSTHAFGITCLAFQSRQTFNRLYSEGKLKGMSQEKYLKLFERIRHDNFFVNELDDKKNLTRITAPVFSGPEGKFAGAIGISLYSTGDETRRISILLKQVKDASARANSILGYKSKG